MPYSQPGRPSAWLRVYASLTWIALLVHGLCFTPSSAVASVGAAAFTVGLHLTWSALAAAVALSPAAALEAARRCAGVVRGPAGPSRSVAVAAIAGPAVIHLLVVADAFVVRRWGFHVNAMVLELLVTPGGIESLGAGTSTVATVAAVAAACLALQVVLLAVAVRRPELDRFAAATFCRPRLAAAAAALVAVSTVLAAGLSQAAGYRPIAATCGAYPIVPVGFRLESFARFLGIADDATSEAPELAPAWSSLRYPLAPVLRDPAAPRPNVVVLVCESLRADMLTPEVMPATCAFAAGGRRFDRHYSAGNGTQMGVFGLLYGLTGSYWPAFLAEHRGPVLLDVLRDAGYDLEAFTSARFTYPQFDRTAFAAFAREKLHERDPCLSGWQNDRVQVDRMLGSIDAVPCGRPFFRFEFFESPHAPYGFPEESVIRRDYARDVNYVAMDLHDPAEVRRVFNRYVNSCRHLDSQLARVFDGLGLRGLLESTVVLVVGDHGEEFMEHGHWGHHSAVTDAQTRTPCILRGPGVPPGAESAMTSHLDVAPTLLRLVGVRNPPADHCLGRDLVEGPRRTDVRVSAFDDVAVVTDRAKLVYGFRGAGSLRERTTTAGDEPAEDDAELRALRAVWIAPLIEESRRFLR